MVLPLAGVVVADFTRVLAGPLATMHLADLGADVIKIERPGTGDDTRAWGPPWAATTSTYFQAVNRTKRSVVLDLATKDDNDVAVELAARADVVVENFRAGVMDRVGLGYEEVSTRNPRVVYCSISGFGRHAGAAMPGYDFIVQALGGLMSITGDADSGPMKAGVALVDVLTGKDAVGGILAALLERERSGRGQLVEVNLLSSLLAALTNQASAALGTGSSPVAMGNAHPSIAPYETVRCSDGVLAIACGNDRQFERLTQAIANGGLAVDPRFMTNAARVDNRPALIAELELSFATRSATAWEEVLRAHGVPAGVVNDIGAAFQLAADLGLEPVAEPEFGQIPQVRHPIQYSRTAVRAPLPPPRLGQHTDEIRQWLMEEEDE